MGKFCTRQQKFPIISLQRAKMSQVRFLRSSRPSRSDRPLANGKRRHYRASYPEDWSLLSKRTRESERHDTTRDNSTTQDKERENIIHVQRCKVLCTQLLATASRIEPLSSAYQRRHTDRVKYPSFCFRKFGNKVEGHRVPKLLKNKHRQERTIRLVTLSLLYLAHNNRRYRQ